MNKKLLELLNQINEKKVTVTNLVADGKIEEARAAKEELKDLQDQFDLLKDCCGKGCGLSGWPYS